MKTIGLIGGMTCESSAEYYRFINEITREKLGGIHSARSVMLSVDFAEIEDMMEAGKWEKILEILVDAARLVEKAGADFLVICTNTMHKLADHIREQIDIPILNIIDETAAQIKAQGIHRIGLLGTRFTMEEDFYKGRLRGKHGLEVLMPSPEDVQTIHRIIVDELSIGKIKKVSKEKYWRIIDKLVGQGAAGIILGCTE
ncbi:MAG: amino acid racemase, partial [Candidatus Aminicenantes bacterium]|nr:amino acid racemase [Candidatus Aminicenantes bacterium]